MSDTERQRHCSVSGCGKPHKARGLCNTHYERWRCFGSTITRRTELGAGWAFIAKAITYNGSDCLLWPYGKTDGYGCVFDGGKARKVHRIVCEAVHGPQPPDLQAAHNCGVRACVNPLHLRWDTRKGNMADCIAHGTANRGERHSRAKLTANQVRTIRSELQLGRTCTAIATELGVSDQTIFNIRDRKTWDYAL